MAKIPKSTKCPKCEGTGHFYMRKSYIYSPPNDVNVDGHGATFIDNYTPSEYQERMSRTYTETKESKCNYCNGKGWTGSSQYPQKCYKCDGHGKIYQTKQVKENAAEYKRKTCDWCDGTGFRVEMV